MDLQSDSYPNKALQMLFESLGIERYLRLLCRSYVRGGLNVKEVGNKCWHLRQHLEMTKLILISQNGLKIVASILEI
jgi:hypothetical protein